MTDINPAEKRTRSQLTLPDDILQVPLRSPFKDAKGMIRTRTSTPIGTLSSKATDTDDELLLSPQKQNDSLTQTQTRTKRSASPTSDDQYPVDSGLLMHGRGLKRIKRDIEANFQDRPREFLKHSRNHSEPNLTDGKKKLSKRSAIASKKPLSAQDAKPPSYCTPTTTQRKGRAQSVPLFPSTYPIPYVDLRNPPNSPHRARSRSRSPSKDMELKIQIKSESIHSLAPIPDEGGAAMDVDVDSAIPQMTSQTTDLSSIITQLATPPVAEPIIRVSPAADRFPSPPYELSEPKSTAAFQDIPATPMSKSSLLSIPLSPLTPLPETPHPYKFLKEAQERYETKSAWGTSLLDDVNEGLDNEKDARSKHQLTSNLAPSASHSRLPRPSISNLVIDTNQVVSLSTNPPKPKIKGTMLPPSLPPAKKADLIKIPGQPSPSTGVMDAFQAMMKNARDSKTTNNLDKGKSVADSVNTSNRSYATSSFKGKGKAPKGVAKEVKPNVSLKAKMRPREKQKPKPVPLLIPLEDEETQADAEEQQHARLPSPEVISSLLIAKSNQQLKSPRDSSPDIGMESKLLDVLIKVPSELADKPKHSLLKEPQRTSLEEPNLHAITMEGGPPLEVVDDALCINPSQESVTFSIAPLQDKSKIHIAQPAASKPSLKEQQGPVAIKPEARVTRSASAKMKKPIVAASQLKQLNGKSARAAAGPSAKQKASGSVKSTITTQSINTVSTSTLLSECPTDPIPPDSPMKLSSPHTGRFSLIEQKFQSSESKRAGPATAKTPSKSKIPVKPHSTPSPIKLSRSASLFISRPSTHGIHEGSSLSTLSNALEKLRMPPPPRPNTSMGFNRDADEGREDIQKRWSKDDEDVGKVESGTGDLKGTLYRAATLGSSSFEHKTSNEINQRPDPGKSAFSVQKPLSTFLTGKTNARVSQPDAGASRPSTSGALVANKPRIFGLNAGGTLGMGIGARRLTQKASRPTTLPVVIGSPVKAGEDSNTTTINDEMEEDGLLSGINDAGNTGASDLDEIIFGSSDVDKTKEKEFPLSSWKDHVSRRASLASQALSQSLNSLPPFNKEKGLMGPPASPSRPGRIGIRSSSSTYPSSAASSSSPTTSNSVPTRTSSRIAEKTLNMQITAITPPAGRSNAGEKLKTAVNPAVEALKVLKDCVIFVDVKTDDGDEAGSLFVEMLEGVGARILTRVGQTCTHIVYKNGLPSTPTRYRLLRDPKPFVVGIAWVVECVEQRRRVDESSFLIDLQNIYFAGTNKRRRSMLPKLISREIADGVSDAEREYVGDDDQSMESASSVILDDLPPLEKARRRRSMMIGPQG